MRHALLTCCVVAGAVGVGAPLALSAQTSPVTRTPAQLSSAAVTHLRGLPASPAPDVVTAALPSRHPRPGTVPQVAGPFDDRFQLTGVTLRHGTVTGVLTVTSDVSEIVDLQVLVGFYDAAGHYLGSAAFDRHSEDVADVDERVPFVVRASPPYAGRVASAAIGVPELVNE